MRHKNDHSAGVAQAEHAECVFYVRVAAIIYQAYHTQTMHAVRLQMTFRSSALSRSLRNKKKQLSEEEEEGYKVLPANKTDHLCHKVAKGVTVHG